MKNLELSRNATALSIYRREFERHAGSNLDIAIVVARKSIRNPPDDHWDPPREVDPEWPFPRHVLPGQLLQRERLMANRPGVRDFLYLGDPDCLRAYRHISRRACHAALGLYDVLRRVPSKPFLRSLNDLIFIDAHLDSRLSTRNDVGWSLLVNGLLERADRGHKSLVHAWTWGRFLEDGVIPFTPRIDGGSDEGAIFKEKSVVVYTLSHDIFTSSMIAIDEIAAIVDVWSAQPDRTGDGPDRHDEPPVPPTPAHLNLSLDSEGRRVKRGGFDAAVEFGGHQLAWAVLEELHRNGAQVTKHERLRGIWAQSGGTDSPEATTIQGEVSKLRSRLGEIRVGIKSIRGIGYRLVDLPSGDPSKPLEE
jgi:hypothetical protein